MSKTVQPTQHGETMVTSTESVIRIPADHTRIEIQKMATRAWCAWSGPPTPSCSSAGTAGSASSARPCCGIRKASARCASGASRPSCASSTAPATRFREMHCHHRKLSGNHQARFTYNHDALDHALVHAHPLTPWHQPSLSCCYRPIASRGSHTYPSDRRIQAPTLINQRGLPGGFISTDQTVSGRTKPAATTRGRRRQESNPRRSAPQAVAPPLSRGN
jgi:hypothetical protein